MAWADEMARLAQEITDPDTGLSGGTITIRVPNISYGNETINPNTGTRGGLAPPATWVVNAVRSAVREEVVAGVNTQVRDYIVAVAEMVGLGRRLGERDVVMDGGVAMPIIRAELECDGKVYRLTCRTNRLGGGG